jgi:hypothetical protein
VEEKTLKIIMAAIEKQFGNMILSHEETSKARQKIVDGTLELPSLDEVMEIGASIGIWSEIEQGLRKQPEPTQQELEELIRRAPQLPHMVRKLLPKLRKAIPHDPGGAPAKLDAKQKARAVQLVGTLMGRGDSYSEALQNVATRFGVSSKTIQRAWQAAHPRKRK